MLRVYLDDKLKREDKGWKSSQIVDLDDRGRFVCGVEIPTGRKLSKTRSRVLGRGGWLLRVDIKTEPV
jgi:hypothetical protein